MEKSLFSRASSWNSSLESSMHWNSQSKEKSFDEISLQELVLHSRWSKIQEQKQKISSQKAFIRKEKRRLVLQNALLESEKQRFDSTLQPDWFCPSLFPNPDENRLVVQVGGKLFEMSYSTACKDKGSLLASLANSQGKKKQCFKVDGDWWTFRQILNFLRDDLLPKDPNTLKQMYLESDRWKLQSLQRAIEKRVLPHQKKTDLLTSTGDLFHSTWQV